MASQGGDSDLLETLYPAPLSTGITPFPGDTSESTRALLSVLKHNYQTYHSFFNDKGYHNHATHHVLAIYNLGASPELIEGAYKTHDYLLPAIRSPGPITEMNFVEHLGDERYYSAYLTFFSEYLRDHTPNEAFERFIFSPSYNFDPDLPVATVQDVKNAGKEGKIHPEMLNRLMSILMHPFIHLGYGFEFGIPGQVAEGLAFTAVHRADQTEFVPPSFFTKSTGPGTFLSGLTSRFSLTPIRGEKRPTFAFFRRLRDHPKLSQDALRSQLGLKRQHRYRTVLPVVGDSIAALVEEWENEWLTGSQTNADVEKRLEGMVEEVAWGTVIWFAVRGWQTRGDSGRAFNADFFVVHLVTSALFLLALVLPSGNSPYPPAPLSNRVMLLKAYVSTCAAWYISQGNGPIPIEEFYAATSDRLTAPPAVPAPPDAKRKPISAPGGPWGRIIANAMAHPEEHVSKTVRSLAVFATRWGSRPRGYFADGDVGGLEGREVLDGTLFVRAANLTLDRLGWAHESGNEPGDWDRESYTTAGV